MLGMMEESGGWGTRMGNGCKLNVQYQHDMRIWTCGSYTL
jgi:hypothetical protein